MTSHKNSHETECPEIDNYILTRLKKGLSTHIFVTGLGGSGKSSFSVRTAERLSSRIKNGVEFTHKDIIDSFIKLLKRITEIKSPGEIIVIEEVSVLFPSKRAMSQDNVAIGMIMDTIRKKRCILFSNAPLFKTLDSHMRAMANLLVECKKVLKTEALVKLKAWRLKTDPHTAKTYRFRFRRGNRDIMYHFSKRPNPQIWETYEKDKDRFIQETYKRLQIKAEAKFKKENKELRSGMSEKDKRDRGIWFKHKVEKKSQKQIAAEEDMTEGNVSLILKKFRENGNFPLEIQKN